MKQMKNLSFLEISEEDFRNLEKSFRVGSYYQTVNWGYLKELTGWDKHFIGVYDGDRFRAATLLLSKKVILSRSIFYAPRGILTNYKDKETIEFFTCEIMKYVKNHVGFLFKMDPLVKYTDRNLEGDIIDNENNKLLVSYLKTLGYVHKGFTVGYTDEIQYRWSFYLDTFKSDEEIIKLMNNRCKRSLKKAQKYPLIIREVEGDELEDLKIVMEDTCKRHKCYDRSLEYYRRIKEVFKDKARMMVVYLDREEYLKYFEDDKLYNLIKKEIRDYIPISAGVFISDEVYVHYVYGGTRSAYMCLESQYKLHYYMIKYARNEELPIYDFGGISGNFDKGSPNYGVYDFKRGFGGYVVEYIGEFDLVINNFFYRIYKFMYKCYGLLKSLTGYVRGK